MKPAPGINIINHDPKEYPMPPGRAKRGLIGALRARAIGYYIVKGLMVDLCLWDYCEWCLSYNFVYVPVL